MGTALKAIAGKTLATLGAEKLKKLASYAINKTIDILPVEIHLPGYNYCGPGTKLQERLRRGDKGVNPLDKSCMEHDIAYSKFSDSKSRSEADRILQEQAWKRVTASDAALGERAAAYVVTNAIKAKRAIGGRIRKSKKSRRKKTRRVKS